MVVNSPLAELATIIAQEIRPGLAPQPYFGESASGDNGQELGAIDDPQHVYIGRIFSTDPMRTALEVPGAIRLNDEVGYSLELSLFSWCASAGLRFIFVGYRIPLYA